MQALKLTLWVALKSGANGRVNADIAYMSIGGNNTARSGDKAGLPENTKD